MTRPTFTLTIYGTTAGNGEDVANHLLDVAASLCDAEPVPDSSAAIRNDAGDHVGEYRWTNPPPPPETTT